ncbi:MAG: transcriptional regulator NrdR [Candidatus Micrarchaeota archaeon]
MNCPYCFHVDTRVLETRESDPEKTRRRRECLKCKKRFTTYERIELTDLRVIKKDGREEAFDRNKLKKGILLACEKRPVSSEVIEEMVDEIERKLRNLDSTDVPSSVVGEMVMESLKTIDKVAYIRFASVYRSFADVDSFEKEVARLKKKQLRRHAKSVLPVKRKYR